MSLLRRAGLITARRGNNGGYRLARPAAEITVAEIVAATEDLGPPTWVTGNGGSDETGSPFAETWQAILDPSLAAMRAITLADLVHRTEPRRHARLSESSTGSTDPPPRPAAARPARVGSPSGDRPPRHRRAGSVAAAAAADGTGRR